MTLPRLVRASLAATIVLVVLASGSVRTLVSVASPLRWAGLCIFAGLALLWARSAAVDPSRLLTVLVPAGLLSALALDSTVWSVTPGSTFAHAVSFALLLLGAGAVATVARDVAPARLVAEALVGAATVVCLAGPCVYAFVPHEAAQLQAPTVPFRWAGLGENPNTVQLLAAVCAVPALWLTLASGGRRRVAFGCAFVVLCAQVVASGSRDGAIGVALGALVFVMLIPLARGARVVALFGVFALAAALVGGVALLNHTALPEPSAASAARAAPAPAPPSGSAIGKSSSSPKLVLPPLDYEFGTIQMTPRTLFGTGGRAQAIREGIDQANERPVAGWGFGTEQRVFINRVATFRSNEVEDSYVGLYLELGALAPLLWVALALALAWSAIRARRRLDRGGRLAVAGLAGAAASGYVLGVGQSYVYSAGNVATLTFWLVAFLTAGIAGVPPRMRLRPALAAALLSLALLAALAVTGRSEAASAESKARAGIVRMWNLVGARLDGRGLDGFRGKHPLKCLIYAADGTPTAYELCFDQGRLVEAIERTHGFRVWTLRPYGAKAATVVVPASAVDHWLRKLGAFGPGIMPGPGYIVGNR